MKMFTKLALVSSIAISANAMAALTQSTDAELSAATGQDGINLGIGISKIEIEKVLIHDNDGLNKYIAGGNAAVAGNDGPDNTPGTSDDVAAIPEKLGSLGGTGNAGAIVIKADGKTGSATKDHGIVITANTSSLLDSHNLADIVIDTDAGAGGGNTAFLNIAAQVSGLNIAIGEIGVSASGAQPTASSTSIRRGNDSTNYNAILSGLTLKTGKMDANIQLCAAPQGAMIVLNTTMQGGLTIENLGILDNSTSAGLKDGSSAANRAAGEIRLDSIKVADASGTNLTVDAKVRVYGSEGTAANASKGYLQIVTGSGANTKANDIYIKGVHLGSASAGSIGDVEVQGLQTYYSPSAGTYTKGSVITISGH